MDGVSEECTPRESLRQIADECEHVLHERLAKRFATRDALQSLQRRAKALIKADDGRVFQAEFEKIIATAQAVFDDVINELGVEPANESVH